MRTCYAQFFFIERLGENKDIYIYDDVDDDGDGDGDGDEWC